MTRYIVAAIMAVLIAFHAAADENQDATAQIKALQQERIEVLTRSPQDLHVAVHGGHDSRRIPY